MASSARSSRRDPLFGASLVARAALAGLVLPFACASPAPRPAQPAPDAWVDRDGPATPAPSAGVTAAPVRPQPLWEHASEMAGFRGATPRGRSQHFTGEMEAEVRTNPAASAYPSLGPGRLLPAGAALLEVLYPAGGGAADVLFAMEKRPPGYDPDGGDWEYLILTPTGRAAQRGRLALCRRCHADAPHDHVFGGPR